MLFNFKIKYCRHSVSSYCQYLLNFFIDFSLGFSRSRLCLGSAFLLGSSSLLSAQSISHVAFGSGSDAEFGGEQWTVMGGVDLFGTTRNTMPFNGGELTVSPSWDSRGWRNQSMERGLGITIAGAGGEVWDIPTEGTSPLTIAGLLIRSGQAEQLSISGFTPGSTVTVAFYGGMDGSGQLLPLAVTYGGSTLFAEDLNTTFECLMVDSSGTLTFELTDPVSIEAGDPSLVGDYYLHAMQVSLCGATIPAVVPEPSSALLIGFSGLGLFLRRRRARCGF